MLTQTYIESDLKFTFDYHWVIKKYDEHPYFRILSSHGLKGVDFIGIYKEKQLFLIEIKNYKHRSYSPLAPEWLDLKGETPPLVSIFNEKIKDSLQLIRVVHSVLSRKWWYKFSIFWNRLIGNTKINKDWKFWTKVHSIYKSNEEIHPLLIIELDPSFLSEESADQYTFINSLKIMINETRDYSSRPVSVISKEDAKGTPSGLKIEKLAFDEKNLYLGKKTGKE